MLRQLLSLKKSQIRELGEMEVHRKELGQAVESLNCWTKKLDFIL